MLFWYTSFSYKLIINLDVEVLFTNTRFCTVRSSIYPVVVPLDTRWVPLSPNLISSVMNDVNKCGRWVIRCHRWFIGFFTTFWNVLFLDFCIKFGESDLTFRSIIGNKGGILFGCDVNFYALEFKLNGDCASTPNTL